MAQSPTAKKATDTDTQLVTNEQPFPAFGIIAALTREYTAVKVLLENRRIHAVPGRGAGRQYLLGRVPSASGGSHSVVLALADKGNNMATARATLLLEHFPNVKSIIMVGIAGGVPNPKKPDEHVRLGDIVVSNRKGVVQYDFGKETIAEIVPDPPPRPPSASLLEAVRLLEAAEIEGNRPWLKYIDQARHLLKITRPEKKTDVLVCSTNLGRIIPHPKDPNRVLGESRVFIGPVAAANRVLKNPIKRDQLRDRFDVKAVEMEGSGVADATWYHEVGYLVVRGICDYCDVSKGDDWQKYAAIVASAYTRALLESMPCQISEMGTRNTSSVKRVLLKKEKQFGLERVWNTFKQNNIPQKCLQKLISLQYPWGEFSDVRTSKELRAAERPGSYIVPKPNVARTLFTIEALKELDKELFKLQIQSALKWVSQCIVDGWFKEWLPGPVPDSESSEPVLRKQPSVRHTAQAGIIHVQFPKKDGSLMRGILENILKSQFSQSQFELLGAWPENPNDTNPAFFSTFYALEFLSRIVEGQFHLDVDDLIRNGKTRVKNALTLGFNWLSRDITRGNGLGGASTGGASSYWTAMMLYRLGWKFLGEYLEVRGKIVEALERSYHSFGWYHEPRGRPRDKRSKLRYNIRVLAGLCAIGKEGLGYEYQLIRKAGQITTDSFDLQVADTPDYALIVQIATWLGKDDAKRTLVDSYKPYPGRLRQNRLEKWCRRFSLVRESLQRLKDQGIPDYSDAYEEVDNKVQMLEEEIYVLKKRKKNEG